MNDSRTKIAHDKSSTILHYSQQTLQTGTKIVNLWQTTCIQNVYLGHGQGKVQKMC